MYIERGFHFMRTMPPEIPVHKACLDRIALLHILGALVALISCHASSHLLPGLFSYLPYFSLSDMPDRCEFSDRS